MIVRTTEYQFSHGKMPRGRGVWGFIAKSGREDVALFFAPPMRLSDAKVWASKHAKGAFPDCTHLEVAP